MNKLLLTLVQDTLSAMNSDEVNTIGDTEESEQVTRVARDVFYELKEMRDWGYNDKFIQLEASTDINNPVRMRLPTEVRRINWIRYDSKLAGATETAFKTVEYKNPEDFVIMVQSRSVADNIIEISDTEQPITYKILNDRAPSYWTSFDDDYIWFDSYDSAVDTTLQTSKTLVAANTGQEFSESDTFVIPIPDKDFSLYKLMVVSRAFEEIKQIPYNSALATARRMLIKAQKNNGQRQAGHYRSADYGRRR